MYLPVGILLPNTAREPVPVTQYGSCTSTFSYDATRSSIGNSEKNIGIPLF